MTNTEQEAFWLAFRLAKEHGKIQQPGLYWQIVNSAGKVMA